MNKASAAQRDALTQMQNNITAGLSPTQLQSIATAGDTQRAQQQRQLFQQMFPDLASAQFAAENSLRQQAGGFGPQSAASQVGSAAAQEALGSMGATQQGQTQLIDAALAQLKQGATLPPDVEAQLVQAGLEQSGMVTQNASAQGIGGQQIRTLLGSAGLQLQMQRQQQAAGLLSQAQNLETQRQQVLQDLFPRLATNQLQQASGAAGVFNLGQSATPQAGLSGTQLANSWLQRIGALNQVIGQQGQVNAGQQLALGQLTGQQIGAAASALGSIAGFGLGGGAGGLLGGLGAGGGAAQQNPLTAEDLTLINR